MPIAVRQIRHDSDDYVRAVELRRRILRAPLGLDFTAEQLAAEAGDVHLAGFKGDRLVATLVLSPYDDSSLKLRQMAVDDDLRGSGAGSVLLRAAEDHARATGKLRIVLAARVTARVFYERNGYVAEGEIFTEVTIPHISMTKSLA